MDILQLRQKLVQICLDYGVYQGSTEVVVDVPYIPYIPEKWNGFLVVAEAQNLKANAYANYSNEQKICRLYPHYDCSNSYAVDGPFPKMDVLPWEDGSIPLALKAALDLDPYKTAICNACLWSRRDGNANANPNEEMQKQSRELWQTMWTELEPHISKVVCCGGTAWSVFNFVKDTMKDKLCHPSKRLLNPISGMLTEGDLFKFYPDVKRAYDELGYEQCGINYKQNKIFYACHAVSWLKTVNQL